jgi:hypothetical protein
VFDAVPALVSLLAGVAIACSLSSSTSAQGRSWASANVNMRVRVPIPLQPGARAESVHVDLRNPTSATIDINRLAVRVRSTDAPGCNQAWFRTKPAKVPSKGIAVQAHSSVTLPAQGASPPRIRMIESGSNQDACKNAQLRLSYAYTTRSAAAAEAAAPRASSQGGLAFTGLVPWVLAAGGVLLGLAGVGLRRAARGSSAGVLPGGTRR